MMVVGEKPTLNASDTLRSIKEAKNVPVFGRINRLKSGENAVSVTFEGSKELPTDQVIDNQYIYQQEYGDLLPNFSELKAISPTDEFIISLFIGHINDLVDFGMAEQAEHIFEKIESAKRNFEEKGLGADLNLSFFDYLIAEFETRKDSPPLARFADYIFHQVIERVVILRELSSKENQIYSDTLTGAGSVRAYNEEVTSLISRNVSNPERRKDEDRNELSLIYLDIDHFKQVNDRHNHAVGDYVLQRFAETVRSVIRAGDGFYRKGGEEFVVVIQATKEDTRLVMEKIRKAVESELIKLTDFGFADLQITVSVGSASIKDIKDETRDVQKIKSQLEAMADSCLYFVKQHGRNNIFQYGVDDQQEFNHKVGLNLGSILSYAMRGLSSEILAKYPAIRVLINKIKAKKNGAPGGT